MNSETMGLSDLEARKIASEWHGGMMSPLYALASSGYVSALADDREMLMQEIRENLQTTIEDDQPETDRLASLSAYVIRRSINGRFGTVDGWDQLHW